MLTYGSMVINEVTNKYYVFGPSLTNRALNILLFFLQYLPYFERKLCKIYAWKRQIMKDLSLDTQNCVRSTLINSQFK